MARKKKQLDFEMLNCQSQIGKSFGGSRLRGHPKKKRPFSKRNLIHVILKSSRAKGALSFLHPRHRVKVDRLVRAVAQKTGVEIRDYVNVGNHLHLLIRCSHRDFVTAYLRSLAGLLPRRLMNCEKGRPLGFSFWDARPFTKIVADGRRPFFVIRSYFRKNRKQALCRVEGFDWHHDLDSG